MLRRLIRIFAIAALPGSFSASAVAQTPTTQQILSRAQSDAADLTANLAILAADLNPPAGPATSQPATTVSDPAAPGPHIVVIGTAAMAPAVVMARIDPGVLPDAASVDHVARIAWSAAGARHPNLSGWNAGFEFDQPGTFTISATVTPAGPGAGGTPVTYQTTVVIAPDTRRTLYVSASAGNDANPGTAAAPLASLSAAVGRLGPNTEIVVDPAAPQSVTSTLAIRQANTLIRSATTQPAAVQWTGPKNAGYILQFTASSASGMPGSMVQNLAFSSTYPATSDETSEPSAIAVAGTNICIDRCSAVNLCYFVNAAPAVSSSNPPVVSLSNPPAVSLSNPPAVSSSNPPASSIDGLMVQDCTTTNLAAYSVYLGNAADIEIVGNSFSGSLAEHVIRGMADRVNISQNTLADSTTKNILTPQGGSDWTIAGNSFTGTSNAIVAGPISTAAGLSQTPNESLQWVVIEQNRCASVIAFEAGLSHAIARNNISVISAGQAYILDNPVSGGPTPRNLQDIAIDFNTVSNSSTGGTFLTAFAGFSSASLTAGGAGAQVNGNLYVAPNVQIGNDFAADLTVLQSDLTGFSLISENRWGAPKSLDWHLINPPDGQGLTPNPGGRMMVMPQPLSFAGYRTISSINSAFSLQPSAFDLETSVQLDASFRPQPSVPVPVPSGVFIDFTGAARNATSNAGAVQ